MTDMKELLDELIDYCELPDFTPDGTKWDDDIERVKQKILAMWEQKCAENRRLKSQRDKFSEYINHMEYKDIEEENKRLRKYAQHLSGCNTRYYTKTEGCDCGLSELLAEEA